MREVVTVNEELVKQAWQTIHVKSFNELVTLALTELVKPQQAPPRPNLMDLYGQGGIHADYDYKLLRVSSSRSDDSQHYGLFDCSCGLSIIWYCYIMTETLKLWPP
jgi:hypothetical protein